MNRTRIFGVCLLSLLLGGNPATAADQFDGKTNLICATTHVVGCIDGGTCLEGPARTFDLPDFMLIDFAERVVKLTRESGDDSESPIRVIETTGTQLVLQGIENGHGWSMAIHRDHGRMSTVAVGEDLSFSIFGTCTSH
jgi:hypothetical protein